jgi:5-methylcytosine-specific restriction endonuclease McrA
MTKCVKCQKEFEMSDYKIRKAYYVCNPCICAYSKKWREHRKKIGKFKPTKRMSTEYMREYHREYYQIPEKREMKNARQRKYNQKPDEKEKRKAINKKYYEKNKDRLSEYRRDYNKNNADALKQRRSKNLPKNREAKRAQQAKRRALKSGAKNKLVRRHWLRILEAANGKCYYCKNKFDKLTMDHVIPISKGGDHCASNMVAACISCNSKKYNKILSLL